MAGPTTVYLIRHAQSEPDFALDEARWPLAANGFTQAERLVSALRGVGAAQLISSPYRRALATVEPCARAFGLPIRVEPDLRERHLRTGRVEHWDAFMQSMWADLDAHLPGCESGIVCRNRVTAALTSLANEYAGDTLLVCSHGNAIALFLGGIDTAIGYGFWKRMRMPDVFRVRFTKQRWTWDRGYVYGGDTR